MHIVFVDNTPITPEDTARMKACGKVTIYHDKPNELQLIERVRDAEIIVANFVDITQNIIEAAPQLRYIIVSAVGFDNVTLSAARYRNIRVINCPTQNADAVANYTIALLLSLSRRIVQAHLDLREGKWDSLAYRGVELQARSIGIIGSGRIAKKVGSLAATLGMHVSYTNSKSSPQDVDALLKQADVITLHIPLTNETQHLLDERRLRLMKANSYLINTSRGGVIDQHALITLLKEGHFAGVALDVFEGETYSQPLTKAAVVLAQMRRVIATPHIAYDTDETTLRLGEELLNNIKACLAGKPINVIS
jgi:phosphoglycerate dehydrogenase-like enzyme